jgi:hypothetical protein
MFTLDEIEMLKAAIRKFTGGDYLYSDLDKHEQSVVDIIGALNLRLDHLLAVRENGVGPEPQSEKHNLADLLHSMAVLADEGYIHRVLNPKNEKLLQRLMGDIRQVGLVEKALRKKDTAAALSASADTDLLIDEQEKIRRAADKKDRR